MANRLPYLSSHTVLPQIFMVAMFIFLDAVFLICRIGIEVFDEDIAKEFLMEEEKELTEGSE